MPRCIKYAMFQHGIGIPQWGGEFTCANHDHGITHIALGLHFTEEGGKRYMGVRVRIQIRSPFHCVAITKPRTWSINVASLLFDITFARLQPMRSIGMYLRGFFSFVSAVNRCIARTTRVGSPVWSFGISRLTISPVVDACTFISTGMLISAQ